MKWQNKQFCAISTMWAVVIALGCSMNAWGQEQHSNASHASGAVSQARKAPRKAIKHVIQSYGKALNNADVKDAVAVYADNAILMPDKLPTVKGRAALKAFYRRTFKKIKFHTRFTIDGISVFGDHAVVRTHHLKGSTLRINGVSKPDTDREIFVLKRINGQWKIWRYMFNKNGKKAH